MSHLLARIMLALLMLPLATVLYACAGALTDTIFRPRSEVVPFLSATVVTAAFVAFYWLRLWRHTISWTPVRIQLTIGTVMGAIASGVVVGGACSLVDEDFGLFIGGVASILVWLFLTVLVWRETPEERMARVRARTSVAIVCPGCGYNMTGLNLATCPECGATYSLDELVASQPDHEQTEIERVE